MRQALTYADVLIVPKYSDIESRTEIDITNNYFGFYKDGSPRDRNRLPIISAPMDYVTGLKMAKRMHELNAYGIISRFGDVGPEGRYPDHKMGLAIGVSAPWEDTIEQFYRFTNLHSICVDVAHGDHKKVIDLVKRLKEYTQGLVHIIAGNVATVDGFLALEEAGADAIRVGIGAGSACSTRENTGIGVPQLTAVMDCATIATTASVIADGGIESPGDIVKALAAGADAVMLGKMLAGHDESPGDIISSPKSRFYENSGLKIEQRKPYRGQSIFGSNGSRNAPEGVEGTVPYKGPVADTIEQLTNYIRSGFSYVGARNIEEFRQRAEFIQVSPATLAENKTRI